MRMAAALDLLPMFQRKLLAFAAHRSGQVRREFEQAGCDRLLFQLHGRQLARQPDLLGIRHHDEVRDEGCAQKNTDDHGGPANEGDARRAPAGGIEKDWLVYHGLSLQPLSETPGLR
jgi:hypothetical protein